MGLQRQVSKGTREKPAKRTADRPNSPVVARPRAQRLSPGEREALIVAGAVRYFAEAGFAGDTRSLARHLGVGQPLLFKYFPTKEALIERVYQEVFVGRWNPYWETIITSREKDLETRLSDLYKAYARAVLHRDWIRLFMFAGLKKSGVNTRWLQFITQHMVKPICAEMRLAFDLPDSATVPVTDMEVELVLGISSRIVSYGLRKFIYDTPIPKDLDPIIEAEVAIFVRGSQGIIASVVKAHAARRRNGR
jgi:AcrR family transcriptional regulator